SILDRLPEASDRKLVITTAITPTKAGEGKTPASASRTQGLGVLGKKVALAIREPSMGPVFGIKGGGTGGGYAQVVPMEDINLHFNGDFHAVTAAHNLLAAALDASIFHGNPLGIDTQTITWPRTLDVNDRELRGTVVGLGGRAHGIPRENEFVITAASEIMAILALRRRARDDGAGDEVARRTAVRGARHRRPRGARARRRQPGRPHRDRPRVRDPLRRFDQRLPDRHGRRTGAGP